MFKKRLLPAMIALAAVSAGAQEQNAEVDEIVVLGVRAAELNAREEERTKNIFSSVISQDDAGNFADQNVAEALQRLPGITLQKSEGEGKFVTVRGLGPGFVSVNMNGNELASSSSDTRAFALDAVPADLLSSIEVFKSLTPDMDLNSIGGTVNVKTVSAFDRKKDSFRVSGQIAHQQYSGENSPKISLQGTNLFADDTIGLGYSASYEKRYTDVYEVRHHANEELTYRQKFLKGMDEPEGAIMLTPWQFENREEQAERERTALSVDLGWRPNENHDFYVRYSYTSLDDLDIALREYYRFDLAFIDDLNDTSKMQANEKEIAYIDPASGVFGVLDAELQHQFFIQKGTAETNAFDIGGKNIFNDSWTLDYNYSRSVGKFSKPDGRRVQFRTQDLAMLGKAGKDYFAAEIVTKNEMAELSGASLDAIINAGGNIVRGERRQANMSYDNIFIEDSFRNDTLSQFNINLRKDFDHDFINYVKAGINFKERERDRNKDRWSIVPGSFPAGCEGDIECLRYSSISLSSDDIATHTPNHPDFQYDLITRADTERLLGITSRIAKWTDPNQMGQESRKEDYFLTEDTQAAYVMAEIRLSEKSSVVTGVRYENTDFASDGYLAIRNDRFADDGEGLFGQEGTNMDIAIPLLNTQKSYDGFFPSIHYRYELNDETLVRASLWSSFTRPSFDQARAFAEIVGRVNLCNPVPAIPSGAPEGTEPQIICNDNPPGNRGSITSDKHIVAANGELFYLASENTLRVGNPHLVAMTSANFDTSISWYGDNGDHWQVAAFYKDIDDFIVEVRGASLGFDQLPQQLPLDQITQFHIPEDLVIDRVNTTINGDNAKVYGVELTYSKYFDSGFFVQSNLTLMDSKAKVGDTVRVGSIQLPDQANETFNLSVGWEKDGINARLIGNYRSKVLNRIGSCSTDNIAADLVAGYPQSCRTWADVYQDKSATLDFKASYQYNKALKFTFDATNLTDHKDIYYFQGNEYSNGNVLFASEDYGRSYLIGVSYNFL